MCRSRISLCVVCKFPEGMAVPCEEWVEKYYTAESFNVRDHIRKIICTLSFHHKVRDRGRDGEHGSERNRE